MPNPITNSGWHRLASKLEANLKEDLMEFLEENPNPPDTAVHEWAEERGYEVDDIEEVVYEIATDHVQMVEESEDEDDSEDDDDAEDSEEEGWEDEVEGGKADDKEPGDYDLDQLLKGIEVEFEHTDKPELALEIAMDHLEEIDDYYDDLAEMEDKAKKEAKMKLQGISQKGIRRISSKMSQTWKGDAGYLEDIQRVIQDVQESVQDYGEDVETAIESHVSQVRGYYRLALLILQNSANVDRDAVEQLAYEAMKADILQGIQ